MPRKIIIDTDPGVDDVLAILLGIASPEVDVGLISIVFGNTHARSAHANLLKIYALLAREVAALPDASARYGGYVPGKTVLALGADDPIGGTKAVAAYFHGKDGLSNLSETHPQFTPDANVKESHIDIDSRPSWEVMVDMLEKEESGSITIVALGPLTNVAHALRASPQAMQRLGGLVWMGGALEHSGNTSPTAEFNCFADPYAAAEVLTAVKQGLFPLVMAPLDITTPHLIPFDDLIHPTISGTGTGNATTEKPTPIEEFIGSMLVRVRGLQASFGLPDAMEMHDPVAVWYAIENALLPSIGVSAPADGFTLRQRDFQIERNGELTRGMCVVDRRGTGESGGEVRTKGNLSTGEGVVNGNANPAEKGRMGDALEKPKNLPYVITKTPGKEVLRKVLLERVFGRKV